MALSVSAITLRRVANDLTRFSDGRDIPDDVLDSFIVSLEFVYREILLLEAMQQLKLDIH